jgi:hypothetical protein
MAQPTNTYDSYDAASAGNREDLSNIIYTLDQSQTPVLSSLRRVPASATNHQWTKDALAAASSSNFNIEGDEATTTAITAASKLGNYTAISDKVPLVTGTQDVVDKAGPIGEMAKQMEKMMKELKRDVEAALLENNAAVAGNASTARECAGLQAWVVTNQDVASDATSATGDGTDAHTDGTARPLTENMFESVLADCWDSGGNPTMGVMGKFQKRKVAAFSGNATQTANGDDKKVTNSVDVYIDPLGSEIMITPCRQCPTDVVYFIDPEYAAFSVLRDFQSKDLPSSGDYSRKQILVEYTLEVGNEAAHGGIYDLSAS